jgi:hypothetical protein
MPSHSFHKTKGEPALSNFATPEVNGDLARHSNQ